MNLKVLILAAGLAPVVPALPTIPASPIPSAPARMPHPTIPGLDVVPAQLPPARPVGVPGGAPIARAATPSAMGALWSLQAALESRLPAAAALGSAFERKRR